MPCILRDEIINFITYWITKLELPVNRFLVWLAISSNRYYDWKRRYEEPNKHNGCIPKSHWLLSWEREALISYAKLNPQEG